MMGTTGSTWARVIAVIVIPALAAFASAAELASLSSVGGKGNANSHGPAISADGRFVAFSSSASNLVADDTNGVADIFLRDRATGVTERLSVSSAGVQANGPSDSACISDNGRLVVFGSFATNLDPSVDVTRGGTVIGTHQVYVHDVTSGVTRIVSLDGSGGTPGYASHPALSGDGRMVAFTASGTFDGSSCWQHANVFVRDLREGTIERIGVVATGAGCPDGGSQEPAVSADGRYVAFTSWASNFVADDTNGVADVFVRDRQTQTTTRVSVSSSGAESNGESRLPRISANGRYVVYQSLASNLVAGDTNATWDVYLRDRLTGTTRRLSLTADGGQGDSPCTYPAISADGAFVAFETSSKVFYPDEYYHYSHIVLCDVRTGGVTLVDRNDAGALSLGASVVPALDADGSVIAFGTAARNFDPSDTDYYFDVYVRSLDRSRRPPGAGRKPN